MIRIGFDEDVKASQYDEDGDERIRHGDGWKQIEESKKTVYIPERRIQQIKDEFDCVVVRDFGDEYHLSEEERNSKNAYYQAFKKFNRMKKKYRKLDEFVVAMREALKCLDFVADNNGIYPPDKFKKMFFRDKIYINGLEFPKLVGKERKIISWDYLTEFILGDDDPKNIIPKKFDDELITDEDYEESEKELFTEEEMAELLKPMTKEQEFRSKIFFDPDDDEVRDDDNIVVPINKKELKKIVKAQPEFLYTVKEMKRERRSINNLSGLAYDLMSADIEYISNYDRKHNIVSSSDIPEFKGDMTKGSDYRRYLMELTEWEDENIKDDYHGRQKTLEEIQNLELKQMLENCGWNIRAIYGNKEKEKRLAKIKKKEEKREKELKKKLVAVQNRRKRRMGEDVDDDDSKKKKKKGKKSSEKKVKLSKEQKERKRYQSECEEAIDDILLGCAGRTEKDFNEYEEDVLDFSWDNIMNGGDD